MKKIFYIILNSFFPSCLLFFSKNDYLFSVLISNNILSKDVKIGTIQFWFFLIGVFWTGIILPYQLNMLKSDFSSQKTVFESLLKQYCDSQKKNISKVLGNIQLNVRVFVPQKGVIGWIRKYVKGVTILELIHINGVSDSFHANGIKFKVDSKTTEGIVGKAYKEKTSVIDDDLTTHNTYSLTPEQKLVVAPVQFCAAIPVLNNKNKSISAIVSFDSDEKVTLDEDQVYTLHNNLIYFAAFVDKHIKF